MHGDEDVLALIGDIYDASLDPALWTGALEDACAYVQGATATVMSQIQLTKALNSISSGATTRNICNCIKTSTSS